MRGVAGAILLFLMLAGQPASAGQLLDKAKQQGLDYAQTAGYVASTVAFCGGDASEVVYFKSLISRILTDVGADAEDIAFVHDEMDRVQKLSEPRGRACTDEGGIELSTKLEDQRLAIIKALE